MTYIGIDIECDTGDEIGQASIFANVINSIVGEYVSFPKDKKVVFGVEVEKRLAKLVSEKLICYDNIEYKIVVI